MRGEYAYLAHGEEFARERFSVIGKNDGGSITRARVDGPAIGLSMTMEMHCKSSGDPQQLALSCEYRGLNGTANYSFTDAGITALVRCAGIERSLRARPEDGCVAIPHPICAYRQFAKLAGNGETHIILCWIDVYSETAFLRPRLRRVITHCRKQMGTQSVPAGLFSNLTHICIADPASLYTTSSEGYLAQSGLPVLWRQQDGDTCYVLTSLSE